MHRAILLLLIGAMLAGCTGDDAPREPVDAAACADAPELPVGQHPVAALKTEFGTLHIDLYAEHAPKTVANFVCLVQAGFYDGIAFHRVISDFMMQGGDPLTLDDDPANDGTGGPGYQVPEELHYKLRHDTPGVVSMANSGRTTGGSQFFITFAATPWLDDRHTIFGHAREQDMLTRINHQVGSENGEPAKQLTIQKATIAYETTSTELNGGLILWTPDDQNPVPRAGGETRFIVVLENGATMRAPMALTATGGTIEQGFESFELAGRQRAAFIVTAQVPEGEDPVHQVVLTASNGVEETTLNLNAFRAEIGAQQVALGDKVDANYIGMTPDGRFFDTSVEAVARMVEQNDLWFDVAAFRGEGQYSSFQFSPGAGVIEGFTELAVGLDEGGVNAGRMPPEKAYRYGGCSGQRTCLAGMTLLFQMHVLEIVEE